MESVKKHVTRIDPIAIQTAGQPLFRKDKRRVAAYARVSTDSDEQFTSFEAQVKYYTNQITGNPDWTMVDVYCDEGVTGTNTKKREGLDDDCFQGLFFQLWLELWV